ncbi:MAG: hypothetical protein ACTSU2_01685 [Promethearchaeota archaeon]
MSDNLENNKSPSEQEQSIKNPYNLCIWKDRDVCKTCSINGKLQCHLELKYSIIFGSTFFSFFILALLGIFMFGLWSFAFNITLILWFGYLVVFFLLWEPQMLCRHCPYYAEGGTKVLHCYANAGFLKTAKYTPNPMSKGEKIQFIIGLMLFFVIPYTALALERQFLYLGLSAIGLSLWMFSLRTKICTKCVNFSCPLNAVPKEIVNEFLERNPIIKKAWQEAGKI